MADPNSLFGLFDDKLKVRSDLVAGDPQSLDSIAPEVEQQELILQKIKRFEEVEPKIDYSDFANFVFFNSALDYFNITGEKILNEYPYDRSADLLDQFVQDMDGYQRHVLEAWPSSVGNIVFGPSGSSQVRILDLNGTQDGVSRTGFLNPGTGSFTVEFWCNVAHSASSGSNGIVGLVEKSSRSPIENLGDGIPTICAGGYDVYISGSDLRFAVISGSVQDSIGTPFEFGVDTYVACVFDRSDPVVPEIRILTGTRDSFPEVLVSGSSSIFGTFDPVPSLAPVPASASQDLNLVILGFPYFFTPALMGPPYPDILSGAMDEVRIWNVPRSDSQLTASFNVKLRAQSGLVGLWHFNESGSFTTDQLVPYPTAVGSVAKFTALDSSGRKLNGQILPNAILPPVRRATSLFDDREAVDPVRFLDASEVSELIAAQQTSGSAYDRDNDNLITRLLPEQFFILEEFKNTDVLEKFLYILARNFDFIKVRTDQFTNVLRTNYGEFDQAPDALLSDVARFLGWEFTGNFLSADAFQYVLGRRVLSGTEANQEIEQKLFEIKNEFWRRILLNLIHLYKSKGTRESVEALLRMYGVNKNFVRLKEYGYKPHVGLQTFRIHAEKSVPAMIMRSGTLLDSGSIGDYVLPPFFYEFFPLFDEDEEMLSGSTGPRLESDYFESRARTLEVRVKFPLTGILDPLPQTKGHLASLLTGSVRVGSLGYVRDPGEPGEITTGELQFSSSLGILTIPSASIFDENWYNISVRRDELSGSITMDVYGIDQDSVNVHLSASMSSSLPSASLMYKIIAGVAAVPFLTASSGGLGSACWMQEVRVWNKLLTDPELGDHAMNFQSYGTDDPARDWMDRSDPPSSLHWRLNENIETDISGNLPDGFPIDFSTRARNGIGFGFEENEVPYKKFLLDYNYIASPDFGWNEEKIRVLDGVEVKPEEAFTDNRVVALEFNMVDALNEDISQILSMMENFNRAIGLPANRYRERYADLDAIREDYFKRLQGRLNFRVFSDMLEFFDRSFIDMIRRLIPARAIFLGDEFVVESHMLERPKLQWTYRRQEKQFMPLGAIQVYIRT